MAHERTTVSSSAATTRESILMAALRLFSCNGYEGTSMRDIAGEVGISQGAIYKHFAGKDALLEAICTRMEENDATHAEAAGVPAEDPLTCDDSSLSQQSSGGGLAPGESAASLFSAFCTFTLDMFSYWAADSIAAPFRRMIEIDRFRTPRMEQLHRQYLGAGPLSYTRGCLMSMGMGDAVAQRQGLRIWAAFRLLLEMIDTQDIAYEEAADSLKQVFLETEAFLPSLQVH